MKRAGWRRQAVWGLWEGSKRRLQWRQVRQEGGAVAGVEEGVEEEEEEVQVVGVEEALTSTGEKRSSDRGGQTRHRLSPCLRRGKERHEAEAQELVAKRRLEPATTQHIGEQRRDAAGGQG